MKQILITGGLGFLGSNLTTFLSKKYNVIIIDKNLNNKPRFKVLKTNSNVSILDLDSITLKDIFNRYSFSAIMHTATDYGRSNKSIGNLIYTNIMFPIILVEFAIKKKVPIFINTDTFFTKDSNLNYKYLETYLLSKNQIVDWLRVFSNEIKIINLRLEHVFGPGDNKDKFVTEILAKIISNEPSLSLTMGEQKRDFVFIDDVVEAFSIILNNSNKIKGQFTCYEVGYGSPITIKEFVETIKKVSGSSTILNFGTIPYRDNEIFYSIADNQNLIQLGWQPRYNVYKGIVKMVNNEKALMHARKT